LVPIEARGRDQFDIMAQVRTEILKPYADRGFRVNVGGGGFGGGGVQYVLQGPEIAGLQRYGDELLQKVKAVPGVVDADTSLNNGKPELSVRMNRAKAADLGVQLLGGDAVTTYNETGEQYEVHVRAEASDRTSDDALGQLPIPSLRLGAVTLDNVAPFSRGEAPSDIRRLGRQRQVTVSANLLPGTSQAAVQNAIS